MMRTSVGARRLVPLLLASVVAAGVAAAGADTPAAASSPAPAASSPAPAAASGLADGLPACPQAPWHCGVLDVPLDRDDASLGTVPIHFYVQAHTDLSRPSLEPVLVSPGGPGASLWQDHGFLPIEAWAARHDTILVDPRGVGESGTIMCAGLDAGVSTLAALGTAVAACGASLGQASGRYGSADAARDVDAVRDALGIDAFDYYSVSYATMTAQAYAARFPDRLHALVLDSGFAASDTLDGYYWGISYPHAWLRVIDLVCTRDAACAAAYPEPSKLIERLIHRVADAPITTAPAAGAASDGPVVDEAAVVAILASVGGAPWQLAPRSLLDAAHAALDGHDPSGLIGLAAGSSIFAGQSDPAYFSNGDNVAAQCADITLPWAASDPVAVRPGKLQAAVAGLPTDAFAPFTREGYIAGVMPFLAMCLDWPAQDSPTGILPDGAAWPDVPTLIIGGDTDTQAPFDANRGLLDQFPHATEVVVAGAAHNAAAPFYGSCGGEVVSLFLDTLSADPSACTTPGS